MKKSLIALAVLAASGASMAQSSVTVYGLVDAYFGATTKETTGTAPVAKLTQTVVNSSGANSSRWGLRGSEDLGNGLKANFVLESAFNTDDGSVPATGTSGMFGRQAFVGLSGDFGSVSLGRQYTAYFTLYNATNNLYDTNLATTAAVWATGIAKQADRTSNSIAYSSPVFSGFSGAAVYGFGEDKNATVTIPTTTSTPTTTNRSASYNASLHLKYANGPLLVGYAYQEELSSASLVTGTSPALVLAPRVKNKYNLFAGSYDFGVAKLTAGYNQAKNDTLKDQEFQVGVSVPFGAAAVAAGFSRSKSESVDRSAGKVNDNTGSGFSLLGTYSLSKRTTLYAGYNATKVESKNGTTELKSSVAGVGVRHTF